MPLPSRTTPSSLNHKPSPHCQKRCGAPRLGLIPKGFSMGWLDETLAQSKERCIEAKGEEKEGSRNERREL